MLSKYVRRMKTRGMIQLKQFLRQSKCFGKVSKTWKKIGSSWKEGENSKEQLTSWSGSQLNGHQKSREWRWRGSKNGIPSKWRPRPWLKPLALRSDWSLWIALHILKSKRLALSPKTFQLGFPTRRRGDPHNSLCFGKGEPKRFKREGECQWVLPYPETSFVIFPLRKLTLQFRWGQGTCLASQETSMGSFEVRWDSSSIPLL